jgi:hypothetical protein
MLDVAGVVAGVFCIAVVVVVSPPFIVVVVVFMDGSSMGVSDIGR